MKRTLLNGKPITFQNHIISDEVVGASSRQIDEHFAKVKGIEVLKREGNRTDYKFVDPYEYIGARQHIREYRRYGKA